MQYTLSYTVDLARCIGVRLYRHQIFFFKLNYNRLCTKEEEPKKNDPKRSWQPDGNGRNIKRKDEMKKVVVEDQTRTEERVQSDQKVEHLYNNNDETLQTQRKSVRKSNAVISLDSLSTISYHYGWKECIRRCHFP